MSEAIRENLSARIEYRCKAADKERLRAAAASRGQTLSELITEGIKVALGEAEGIEARTKTVVVKDYGLIVAVNRIGNNLNQVSHGINRSLKYHRCPNWAKVETALMLIHCDLYCLLELAESFGQVSHETREQMNGIFAYLAMHPHLTAQIMTFMDRETHDS